MPILIMGLMALAVFGLIGILLLAAEVSEHRKKRTDSEAPEVDQSAPVKH